MPGGSFHKYPANWREIIGVLAEIFHFQPSELMAMVGKDLEFWLDRLKEVETRQKRAVKNGG